MPRRLSILDLLAALVFCAASALRADLAATPVRLPGSSLDTSIRNEADHAVRQAARWLADRQQPDGAWGGSNRVRLTSLALSALASARQPGQSETCVRAALWLGGTETNRLDSLGDHAWRLIALAAALPETPERAPLLARFASLAHPLLANAPQDDLSLLDDAVALAGVPESGAYSRRPGHPSDPDTLGQLARAAALWPPPLSGNRAVWRLARILNLNPFRAPFEKDGLPIDWRADLAQRLINTQKTDPRGGGFWTADSQDRQIAETAYGILCLQEL
jgi:hypothetical protein